MCLFIKVYFQSSMNSCICIFFLFFYILLILIWIWLSTAFISSMAINYAFLSLFSVWISKLWELLLFTIFTSFVIIKTFWLLFSMAFLRFLPILLTCQEFRTEPYVQSTKLNLFLSHCPLLRISLLNYYSPKDCTKNYYVTKFTNQRFIQTRILSRETIVNIAFGALNLICLLLRLFLMPMLVILDSIHQDFSFCDYS